MSSNGIPTAGYKTRTDAVAAFHKAGLDIAAIAERCEISVDCAKGLLSYHKRRRPKHRAAAADGPHTVTAEIPFAALDVLQGEAALRGLTTSGLVSLLLRRIADDDLVDAVLDDQDDAGAAE